MEAIIVITINDNETLTIQDVRGVERARRFVRAYASSAGLSPLDIDELVLATSELAGNLLSHTQMGGTLNCRVRKESDRLEVNVEVKDGGPGIRDISRAMEDGFSTTGSLGSGLPAARRLVDVFEIKSSPEGTTIRIGKLLPGT